MNNTKKMDLHNKRMVAIYKNSYSENKNNFKIIISKHQIRTTQGWAITPQW